MAAVLTGTPTAVTWASGADPAGQSITIPADATAVYMFWGYDGGSTGAISTATLNGNSWSQMIELANSTLPAGGCGCAVWYNPATGSQTLDVAWDVSPGEGPTCIVAYVKGGDTTAWRDAQTDQDSSTTDVTVTLTTESGDLVLAYHQHFDGSNVAPGTPAGWTSAQTHGNNSQAARLYYISATGTTQAVPAENESWSALVAISIPAGSGGGGGATNLMGQALL